MTIITDPATYSVELRRNLVPNPAARSLSGYSATATGGAAGMALLSTSVLIPEVPGITTGCRGLISGNVVDGYARIYIDGAAVEPLATYTASAYCYRTAGSGTAQIIVRWRDGSGTIISESLGTSTNLVPAAWERRSMTLNAPAGASSADVEIRWRTNIADGTRLFMTAVLLEKTLNLGSYFDGATVSPDPVRDYSWTGPADASASILSEVVAADRVDPAMILGPWRVSRDTRRVRHQLLDSPESRYTIRPADLAGGVLEMLFTSYAAATGALSKFDRDTVWRMFEQIGTDPTPVDLLFTVDEGQMEIEQSGDSRAPFLVRIPWKEG